jgi:HEAT repeat protein
MRTNSSMSGERQCDTVRDWLRRRPLRDNPQMAGGGSDPSLTWEEWVEQGRNAIDTEVCLLDFIEDEQDPVTRSEIAMALGYVGSDRSVGRLIELLKDKEPMVGMEAAAALGRLEKQDAVPHLIEALKSDHPNVRANASQALGLLGGDEANAALTEMLGDDDPFVRSAAQDALSRSR